ncbi:hypothetical protein H0H87_012720, partial [Tephrocybe sp. NHM501043]
MPSFSDAVSSSPCRLVPIALQEFPEMEEIEEYPEEELFVDEQEEVEELAVVEAQEVVQPEEDFASDDELQDEVDQEEQQYNEPNNSTDTQDEQGHGELEAVFVANEEPQNVAEWPVMKVD